MAQPQTIARPYAKAVFSIAGNDVALQEGWQQFLNAAAELISTENLSQHVHAQDFSDQMGLWLNEWLQKARENGTTEQENNLLRILKEHGRLEILPEIATLFSELCAANNNSCVAHVRSASALDEQAQNRLIAILEEKLGKRVSLEIEEAPELIAGVVIEYDGQVINQSLQGRLQQLARKLDD